MPPPRRAAAVSAASNLAAAAAPKPRSASGTGPAANAKEEPVASSSKPPAPFPPLSPIVTRLRTMWKFAAICQFLFTFDEAFGMSGFETDRLEADLDGSETAMVPDLFRRLLYTLTLNRTVDESNWEHHLRMQYLKREPDEPLLGTEEEPRSWHALSLEQKVESIHTCCEWQLWDAERFRKLVKNEEDAEVWRIDPIGWDAEDNTYWLFDDNRLWIQHPPPPPPPTKVVPKKGSKKAKAEARREAQKRKREAAASAVSTPAKAKNGTPSKAAARLPRSTPTRSSPRGRQANGEAAPKQQRRSLRGRGNDEWEKVPAGLLDSGEEGGDGDSDLSDPPEEGDTVMDTDVSMIEVKEEADGSAAAETHDESMDVDHSEDVQTNGNSDVTAKTEAEEEKEAKEEEPVWIEFETLAVTRSDWEWMATRFAKSKHPDEKALHQLLKSTVLPKVRADLEEAEKQRALELAMANRKRSSRIAMKESEKEERERDRVARQKMEEKMAAIRAEEEDRIRREQEEVNVAKQREERLREREERLLAREREAMERAQREIEEREERERMRELRKLKREQMIANGGHAPEDDDAFDAQMAAAEEAARQDEDSWELDCEVCGKSGINLDESDELVCCEQCGKWQHTECWNAFDQQHGQPRRDWENVDFFCSRCRPPAQGEPRPGQAAAPVTKDPAPSAMPVQVPAAQAAPSNGPPAVPATEAPRQAAAIHAPVESISPTTAAAYSSATGTTNSPFANYTTLYGKYGAAQSVPRPASQLSSGTPGSGVGSASSEIKQTPTPPSTNGTTIAPKPAQAPTPPQPSMAASTTDAVKSTAPAVLNPPAAQAAPKPVGQSTTTSQTPAAPPVARPAPAQLPVSATVPPPQTPLVQPVTPAAQPPAQSVNGSPATSTVASTLAPKETQSVSQGSDLVASRRPSDELQPMRNASGMTIKSPGSGFVPRHVSQPSGSFPLRRASNARSPLSGPHHPAASPSAVPAVSLGQPLRAMSPTPGSSGLGRPLPLPVSSSSPPVRPPSTLSPTTSALPLQTQPSQANPIVASTGASTPAPAAQHVDQPSAPAPPHSDARPLPATTTAPPPPTQHTPHNAPPTN